MSERRRIGPDYACRYGSSPDRGQSQLGSFRFRLAGSLRNRLRSLDDVPTVDGQCRRLDGGLRLCCRCSSRWPSRVCSFRRRNVVVGTPGRRAHSHCGVAGRSVDLRADHRFDRRYHRPRAVRIVEGCGRCRWTHRGGRRRQLSRLADIRSVGSSPAGEPAVMKVWSG